MLKVIALLSVAWCGLAQEPQAVEKIPSEKAPPAVDAALRKRVSQFYQAHVDGKFRLADQVVAEDAKDDFFAAPKPRYEGFEIIKIGYFENFQKAEVLVGAKGTWSIRGEKMTTAFPITTNWKVIDGEWFWYTIPNTVFKTPFGTMNFNSGVSAQKGALPGDPRAIAAGILSSVRANKTDLMLSSYEHSTAEVEITNGMAGAISLRAEVDGAPKELVVKLDKDKLNAGEVAKVTLTYDPPNKVPKPTLTLRVTVEPTGVVIPVKLTFAIPPELEKQIPKDARPQQ